MIGLVKIIWERIFVRKKILQTKLKVICVDKKIIKNRNSIRMASNLVSQYNQWNNSTNQVIKKTILSYLNEAIKFL